jgi:hypothetical protein
VKTGGPPERSLVTIRVAKVLTLSAILILSAQRIASGVATYSVGHQARISVTFATLNGAKLTAAFYHCLPLSFEAKRRLRSESHFPSPDQRSPLYSLNVSV